MSDPFTGQGVLITGASSGIGEAIARQLAARGAHLALVARRRHRLLELAKALAPAVVEPIVADLREPEAPSRVYADAAARLGQVDGLVNNAGVGQYGRFDRASAAWTDGLIRLNVLGVVTLAHLAAAPMADRGRGWILNVASLAAFQPTPWMGIYGASKAFVLSLSESMAVELAGSGVRVCCLCPGRTRTEFFEHGGYRRRNRWLGGAMPAEVVARAGLAGVARGKAVVVPGAVNTLTSVLHRVLPRSVVAAVSARVLR